MPQPLPGVVLVIKAHFWTLSTQHVLHTGRPHPETRTAALSSSRKVSRNFEGWFASRSSLSKGFFRLEDGMKGTSQLITEMLRLNAARLGDPDGETDGDGLRVNAGVGGNDDGRIIEEHVRVQTVHTGDPHLKMDQA